MKKRIFLIIVFIFCLPAYAGQTIIENVVYGHKDGLALFYDIYKSEEPNGAGIIYIMSGGWFSRWIPPLELSERFSPFTDAGYTVLTVYHGSAPKYKVPEAYADVSRAVRHIRMHAREVGLDPEHLGVTGGSAGGHLALMIGLNSDKGKTDDPDPVMRVSNQVAAVVAYYPPVDLRMIVGRSLERFPALDFPKEQAASISPILFVTQNDPPTMLIHGDADKLVPKTNSRLMHRYLKKQGVSTDLLIIEGGDHGFRNPDHHAQASKARLEWFDKYLRK